MLLNRILGVFKFDVRTYEEIEHDPTATGQAAVVVAIVALLSAVGSGFGALFSDSPFITTFLSAFVWTFISWFLVALVTYLVGTAIFNGTATLSEMLRVIGFAFAPLMLSIIPCVGGLIGAVWAVATGFIAVRQGLDLDSGRAMLTIVVGFGIYILGSIVINILFGGLNTLLAG